MSGRADAHVRGIVGQRVRAIRRQQRLSQERLGTMSGLSGKFIGEVERGEKSISIDSFARVSRALRTPMTVLVAMNSDKPEPHVEQVAALLRKQPAKMQSRVLAVINAMTATGSG